MPTLTIATRKSPLALAQTNMVAAALHELLGFDIQLMPIVTTGDKQTAWSLEKRGGKGLFTKELEQALLEGRADLAVHSAKDLPGDQPEGLEIAGYLPRADPRDVLIVRDGIEAPATIATSSPRRRLQLGMLYPDAEFTEIRGNVDTRLRKIAHDHVADATVLAAAGLGRLGIGGWEGLEFRVLGFESMVPAVAQAAIAVQCRAGEGAAWAKCFHPTTSRRVELERAFQTQLGGGCHTALGVHVTSDTLWFFHDGVGLRSLPLSDAEIDTPHDTSAKFLAHFGLSN
ncbi:hydroxymethylbilane synthase [Actomonas aquatica]|uniref:Hydroxymethylbilane synthase n=1 Tax=Actomonas aquatica TaxID=2866162 RepID=A0ABZ1CAF0_9BACT|nr:hydroxymethylbilane synthase [Opitutus sp. WL0086]WRQ88355.1 hydroxymethylbilane synthase [Opitutus sp. WL0086]